MIRRIPPGSVFRNTLAFSRAVEAGDVVHISATGPTDAGGHLTSEDAFDQTNDTLDQIESALAGLDLRLEHVTRIRIYLQDYAMLPDILKAQHPRFDAAPPACSVVCVAGFHVTGMHVYIEADAIAKRG